MIPAAIGWWLLLPPGPQRLPDPWEMLPRAGVGPFVRPRGFSRRVRARLVLFRPALCARLDPFPLWRFDRQTRLCFVAVRGRMHSGILPFRARAFFVRRFRAL